MALQQLVQRCRTLIQAARVDEVQVTFSGVHGCRLRTPHARFDFGSGFTLTREQALAHQVFGRAHVQDRQAGAALTRLLHIGA